MRAGRGVKTVGGGVSDWRARVSGQYSLDAVVPRPRTSRDGDLQTPRVSTAEVGGGEGEYPSRLRAWYSDSRVGRAVVCEGRRQAGEPVGEVSFE